MSALFNSGGFCGRLTDTGEAEYYVGMQSGRTYSDLQMDPAVCQKCKARVSPWEPGRVCPCCGNQDSRVIRDGRVLALSHMGETIVRRKG